LSDRILREIARTIGTPLIIDTANQNKIFGHYVRVLVDVDFSRAYLMKLWLKRGVCNQARN